MVAGSGALAALLLAQKFGRNAETDGLLAAYGVYLALGIGAQAFRMVVVPELTRAAGAGRVAEEAGGYVSALLAVGVPATVLVTIAREPLGQALTGSLPSGAAAAAADALPWVVAAAFAQLVAAIVAAALATRDFFGVAALAYSAGAVAGLALFVALADEHGVVALAWGVALNGAVTLAIPLCFVRLRLTGGLLPGRLWRLVQGAAPALAIQAMYLVSLWLAAGLDVGDVTSLSYAYLIAASLVTPTASTLSMVTAARLTREGLDSDAAARHVVNATWLSFALVAGGLGFFALAGERAISTLLGDAYTGDAGRELGELIVWLGPWTLAAVSFTVTLPLVFVVGTYGRLVALSTGALVLHVGLAWAGRELLGLPGIALALAVSTLIVVADMLRSVSPRTAALGLAGLVQAGVALGAAAAAAYGAASIVAGGLTGAFLGAALYAALLAVGWRLGLRHAWAHVRGLR